jgi:hypothetical protein
VIVPIFREEDRTDVLQVAAAIANELLPGRAGPASGGMI